MRKLEDLFLPYEECKNINILGFKDKWLGYWNLLEYNTEWKWEHRINPDSVKFHYAILYQQAEDFFRRKGYHIEIYSDNHQDILNADNWYWLFSKGINTSCTNSFGSYEEARLDCIRALIKTELNNKS